jgi:hypothetical protein
LVRRPAHR